MCGYPKLRKEVLLTYFLPLDFRRTPSTINLLLGDLNEKIREEETDAAIQLLHKDKAPGPDNFDGDLLQEGSQALIRAINTLFNK